MTKILGLDLSVTGTGLCVLDFDTLIKKTFFSKTIHCEKSLFQDDKLTVEDINVMRLIHIEEEVERHLQGIDLVVIENYAFDAKFNRERLGELHGVIKRLLYKNNIPFLLIDTAKLKKVLTGDSRNPTKLPVKKWVLKETKNRYDIDFEDRDDECDAFGLSFIGLMYKNIELLDNLNVENKVKEEITEVINKIKTQKTQGKKVKKDLSYYFNLKYNIICYFKDNKYITYIKYFDVYGEGTTIKKSLSSLEKNKRLIIREMRKNKKRITYPSNENGKISYIISK